MKAILLIVALVLLLPSMACAQPPPPGFLTDLTPWIAPIPSADRAQPLTPAPDRGWHVADGRLLHVLVIAGIVLQGVDTYLTIKSRTSSTLSEGNVHLAGPLKDRPGLVIGVKAGATIGTAVILWRAHADHPKAAAATAGGILAGYGWVVAQDVRAFRQAGAPIF